MLSLQDVLNGQTWPKAWNTCYGDEGSHVGHRAPGRRLIPHCGHFFKSGGLWR